MRARRVARPEALRRACGVCKVSTPFAKPQGVPREKLLLLVGRHLAHGEGKSTVLARVARRRNDAIRVVARGAEDKTGVEVAAAIVVLGELLALRIFEPQIGIELVAREIDRHTFASRELQRERTSLTTFA